MIGAKYTDLAQHTQHVNSERRMNQVSSDLNAFAKAAFPTSWLPKVMQRTSAVGHCRAAKIAARLAMEPPVQ